jgi:protein involved in polysaccharide export with SLBB domain
MKLVKKAYLLFLNAFVGVQLASGLGAIEHSMPDEAQSHSEQQYLQRQLVEDSAAIGVKDDGFSAYELTDDGLPIFGSQLFQGDFADLSFGGFNPDYQIALGDQIQVLIWGAMSEELKLRVDAKGNVFIPRVGPVHVLGVRNADLNQIIQRKIEQVYKENVESYASLSSTQTVKVFVSGFVNRPGLYQGFASDSVLYYIDRAGGVDPERGSYLQVSVVRGDEVIKVIDLYRFLESGRMPLTQFRDGDRQCD